MRPIGVARDLIDQRKRHQVRQVADQAQTRGRGRRRDMVMTRMPASFHIALTILTAPASVSGSGATISLWP